MVGRENPFRQVNDDVLFFGLLMCIGGGSKVCEFDVVSTDHHT